MPPTLTWTQLYLYPMLTTLVLWGALTVGMLWLNRRSGRERLIVLLLTSAVLILAHHQLWLIRNDQSVNGAYRAFMAGMLIWSWHELAFYSGILTGPWRTVCPVHAQGWRRLVYALGTHLYHILAVAGDMLVLGWMHWQAANITGFALFAMLWLLQLSAKLNVFLGIRNFETTLLPRRMRYLGSFWRKRAWNPFYPLSILVTLLLAIVLWFRAGTLPPSGVAVGMSFLATAASLGVLEHLWLVWPTSSARQMTGRISDRSQEIGDRG